MNLIIPSIVFTISQSNRLLLQQGCATIRCGTGGPCFDDPYTYTPRCCPADEICASNDYLDTTKVLCDGNIYDNKCYGYCAGNKPDSCKPICECNPGNNDCSPGYQCLETPFGFLGCDEFTANSCFGYCVSQGQSCGGIVGNQCEENEQCFYTEIFEEGRGIGYCGSLPNKCTQKPVGCTKDAKICPDGTSVGRVPPYCEFEACPQIEPPNYCGGFENCKTLFNGCSECDCGSDGLGWPLRCMERKCHPTTLGTPFCMDCIDGYELDYESNTCVKSQVPDTTDEVIQICPLVKPQSGSTCNFEGTCYYGKESCCGETFDSYGCNCIEGESTCFYTDACLGAPEKCESTTKGPVMCVADVEQCPDGSYVNRDPNNNCEFKPCPPPNKPRCGGFENCETYNDGCNNCQCGLMGDTCTKMGCPPNKPAAKCIRCKQGYQLNDSGRCILTPSCGGIAYCQSYKKDICNTCGCPDPINKPEISYCTLMACADLEEPVCTNCIDGYVLNDITKQCEKDIDNKPRCGGFKHCEVYNDGCNNCRCGLMGDACTKMACPPGDMMQKPKCIRCEYGYELNEYGKCSKKQKLNTNVCTDGSVCQLGENCYETLTKGSVCCNPNQGTNDCKVGPKCSGIMGQICKPEYECVNDPISSCTYGTDPDCQGICLWTKPTCNDITCKYNDICYELNNGPVCCDPEICMSDQPCSDSISCEEYGLIGYECVNSPFDNCDWPNDPNCAGICVNPNAIPNKETTQIPQQGCPITQPQSFNEICNFEGTCYYGKETCCGETFDSLACNCYNGETSCHFTDACLGAPAKCGTTTKQSTNVCATDLNECPEGTLVSRDPNNNCEFKPCPPIKPPCGGFENCKVYNDGCNDCQCGLIGNACTERFCQEDMIQKSKCIQCEYGYKLNDFGICYKKQPEQNTLPPECAALTCVVGSFCCDDGFGGVKCCSIPQPTNNGKILCENYSDCDEMNGYKCRPDPICRGNHMGTGNCRDEKVCYASDGICDSDLDCQMEYKCVSVTSSRGFCIKYE